ncbi:MAG: hypothetical protein CMH62_00075 [Nanoarchaeota archaeon]|nr:hypothetical protein [Nanoarchaeota archaeon]|tara:strand:+ start:189 stop:521 length:333 start_codon:yes stop_codon:yes gene_type:complete
MLKKKIKRPEKSNSPLLRIVGRYLETKGIDQDPKDWFFSGVDTEFRIRRISEFVFENVHNPSGERVFRNRNRARRIVTRCYSIGKEEYDRLRGDIKLYPHDSLYGPLIRR